MRTTPALLLLAYCAALTACGGTNDVGDTPPLDAAATPTADGPAPADGADAVGAWVLREAEPAVPIPTGLPFELTVEQRGDGTLRVSGHAPCNIYSGTVVAHGGGWQVEGGDYTVDGAVCEPAVMAAEQAYLDALHAVSQWARPSPTVLELTGPATRLRFGPTPETPAVPLVNTTWAVVSTIDGTGPDATVSPLPAGAPQPMLRFGADGLLRVDTGCQGYEGSWTFADDCGIALASLERGVEDRDPCTPNGAALADEVSVSLFEVIDASGFTATVEDGKLFLQRGPAGLVAFQLVED